MKKVIIICVSVILIIFFTLSIINKSLNIHKYLRIDNIGSNIHLIGKYEICDFDYDKYLNYKSYDDFYNCCTKESVYIDKYLDTNYYILTKNNLFVYYIKDNNKNLLKLGHKNIYDNVLKKEFNSRMYVIIRPFKDINKVIVDDYYYYNIKDNEYSKILEGVNLYKGVKYNNLYDVYIYSDENLDSTVINSNGEVVYEYTLSDEKRYNFFKKHFPSFFELNR